MKSERLGVSFYALHRKISIDFYYALSPRKTPMSSLGETKYTFAIAFKNARVAKNYSLAFPLYQKISYDLLLIVIL